MGNHVQPSVEQLKADFRTAYRKFLRGQGENPCDDYPELTQSEMQRIMTAVAAYERHGRE